MEYARSYEEAGIEWENRRCVNSPYEPLMMGLNELGFNG